MMLKAKRIDIHHSITPDIFYKALEDAGVLNESGSPTKKWKVEGSFEMMDKLDIQTGIASISNPALGPIYGKKPGLVPGLARGINEYMAELHENYPRRFGGFAILPLPDVEASLKELEYALDVLKLDGLGLLDHYGPVHLGDPEFEPLFAEMQKRRTVLFIHPCSPSAESWKARYCHVNSLVEFPFCTARCTANLIFSGTLERYPDIQYILSHAGGVIPYLAYRLDQLQRKYTSLDQLFPNDEIKEKWKSLKRTPREYLARMWYDNCACTDPLVFEMVKGICGDYRFLFGSDMGFMADFIREEMVEFMDSYDKLSAEQRYNVDRGFSEKLFPRFAL
jgi:predicted TIM-barrel fold metal-dependent hydrolase